jgi:EmrB/QacA subfamily drug resistance transporter
MAFLDGSVVNVALPVIQRELGVAVDLTQWIVEAYALFLASLVLVGGALGDRLGRKRVFLAGVVVFTAASVGCGAAPEARVLVAARAAQGIGAALLVPGSLALVSAAYPKEERGRAIGIWSMLTAVASAVGPIGGGAVVAHASWRWIFFFNVPLAACVLALAHRGVRETRDESASQQMDWVGAALVTIALGAMTYALIDGGRSLALLVVGVLLLAAFVVYESRAKAPMVPLRLFRNRTFAATNVLTLLVYGALGGSLFFVPFLLIQVEGYSPAAAGAALLPLVVAISVLSPLFGALASRIGARPLLAVGSLACAGGYALLALPARGGGSYWTTYFPGIATLGIGMGIVVAPLTTAVMGSVDDDHAGLASGVNNAVSRAAGLLALAALGLVLRARFDRVLDERLPASVLAAVASERAKLSGADLSAFDDATRAAFADAYVAGFRALVLACAGLAALGAIAGLAAPPVRGSRSPRATPRPSPPS